MTRPAPSSEAVASRRSRGKLPGGLAGFGAWSATVLVTLWSVGVLIAAVRPLALGFAAAVLTLAAVGFVSRKIRDRHARPAAALGIALLSAALVNFGVRPRADREWAFEMGRTPHARIDGDVVTLHEFRNFTWSTDAAQTQARWETRSVRLSRLRGVDLVMVYWGSPHMSHTMASFDFGADGRVCVSIEARREADERYSPTLGAFRKYELLYVLGAESDLIRLRTNIRANQTVRLFPLRLDADAARRQFLGILEAANRVHTAPAWYHTIARNCTTEILDDDLVLTDAAAWSWRRIANGHLDAYLHDRGFLDPGATLETLRRRGDITERARAASEAHFSVQIRRPSGEGDAR